MATSVPAVDPTPDPRHTPALAIQRLGAIEISPLGVQVLAELHGDPAMDEALRRVAQGIARGDRVSAVALGSLVGQTLVGGES